MKKENNIPHYEIKRTRSIIVYIFLIALLSGFIGGITGKSVIRQLEKKENEIITQTEKPIGTPTDSTQKNITKETSTQELQYEDRSQSIVGIYKKATAPGILGSIVIENNFIGHGATLTSDGWIITSSEYFIDNKPEDIIIVTPQQKTYSIRKPIIDESTRTAFLRIDAQNLSVSNFTNRDQLYIGEVVFTIDHKGTLIKNTITNKHKTQSNQQSHSSEKYFQTLTLQNSFEKTHIGLPVFTEKGEIAGIITSEKTAIPIDFIKPVLRGIFKNNKIERPYLGINYIDLSEIILPEKSTYPKQGALLLFDQKINPQPIVVKSPASKYGLQQFDIITKIDNEIITKQRSLTELIQEYTPKSTINVTVIRKHEEKVLSITLE